MTILHSCTKDVAPPKYILLERKIRFLQSLFKKQFKRKLCHDKAYHFLVDSFEPSADELKNFVTSVCNKELKHQLSIHWGSELALIHAQYDDEFQLILKPAGEPSIGVSPSRPEMEGVVQRAVFHYSEFGVVLDPLRLMLDLSAAKSSIPTINFEALLESEDDDFAHDISGVIKNLNRETGHLENNFLLRCVRCKDDSEKEIIRLRV